VSYVFDGILRLIADWTRILRDDAFVFVLLGLVKSLGHTNPVISGVAFNEVSLHDPKPPRPDSY
jgi:hypothetical protein